MNIDTKRSQYQQADEAHEPWQPQPCRALQFQSHLVLHPQHQRYYTLHLGVSWRSPTDSGPRCSWYGTPAGSYSFRSLLELCPRYFERIPSMLTRGFAKTSSLLKPVIQAVLSFHSQLCWRHRHLYISRRDPCGR
jgi:hypothetical protein